MPKRAKKSETLIIISDDEPSTSEIETPKKKIKITPKAEKRKIKVEKSAVPVEKKRGAVSSAVVNISDDDSLMSKDSDDCKIVLSWNIPTVLAENNNVPQNVAENIVGLIKDDNTLPFIARYRKNLVGYLPPERLQEIFDNYFELCKVRKKSLSIIKTLDSSNQLTEDIKCCIASAKSESQLNFLYEPYKVQNRLTKQLTTLKLKTAIDSILCGGKVNFSEYCDSNMPTPEAVKTNLIQALAHEIHKNPEVLELINDLKNRANIMIECKKANKKRTKADSVANDKENLEEKFALYMDFKLRVDSVKPHQTLAINRAEELKVISVKTVVPDWVLNQFEYFCRNKWKNCILINDAITKAYKSFIHPWICRQTRKDMTTKATKESLNVFRSNLKRLLLTSPIKGKVILGIDPGFKYGCKMATIGVTGQVLDAFVLHPKFDSGIDSEGQKLIKRMKEFRCEIIALGNGKACRETEQWLKNIGALKISSLVIVPEEGASIYSCSPEALKEFPGMDPNLISAVSLARRAMDPLSELIKVKPKHLGVGMYQHDIQPRLLEEALDSTIVTCVSFVGADLNTASKTLLRKIAGLTDKRADQILTYRSKCGSFMTREELLKVAGIGQKTYLQCAGFLRVLDSYNKLDNTWIHPENYELAYGLLKYLKLERKDIGTEGFVEAFNKKILSVTKNDLVKVLKCEENDLNLIIEALGQSPKEDPLRCVKPIYSASSQNISDINENTLLTGVVRNVTSFGVFVDCGLGRHGLIHNSKMGNSPYPKLGDKVSVKVLPPISDKKISLRLINIID